MSDNKYLISSTPHIRSSATTKQIMRDVLIALAPACLAAVYFFGHRALAIILLSVTCCILAEQLYQGATKQPLTTSDLSAAVTGLLLAMNLPVTVPFWAPIVGSFFAIIIVKQLFGGLGQNFMNPALAARAMLQISYGSGMATWTKPVRGFLRQADTVSSATPLGLLKSADTIFVPEGSDYLNAFLGNIGGSLGETCAVALILGGVYLIVRKVISWRIPVAYLATFSVLVFIFGRHGLFTGLPLYEILIGGIMLGAFYMATDYSSSPITAQGQLIMGFGCGLLTFIIRVYGGMSEGVCYSILIMNLVVPLIDRFVKPRVYGVKKEAGKHA